MGLFKPAVKQSAKLRLAVTGPAGSGKTYTALAIATHLAGGAGVAMVDTEHGSASKYADLFAFDVAEMHAPFHPDKFIAALREAEAAGYGVVILDSISHAWSGTGGVLDLVDEAAKRSKSGNTYMAWKEGTPVQNRLIDAIVQSSVHVIVTMRSKTEYVLADTGNGKQAPRKVGMAPVQRDQMEYEFDVVLDMDFDNNAIVSKTRCPALTGRVFAKPGADVAGILSDWLQGAPPETPKSAHNGPNGRATPEYTATAQNGPQRPATPATGHSAEHAGLDDVDEVSEDGPLDDPFAGPEPEPPPQRGEPVRPATLTRLHAVGVEFYGSAAAWDAKRPTLVEAKSKGAVTSSRDLTENEARELIASLEQRLAAKRQPA